MKNKYNIQLKVLLNNNPIIEYGGNNFNGKNRQKA